MADLGGEHALALEEGKHWVTTRGKGQSSEQAAHETGKGLTLKGALCA